MSLVEKFFLEAGDDEISLGKVVEEVTPDLYLVTYWYSEPQRGMFLVTTEELTEKFPNGDAVYTFFPTKEAGLAEMDRLTADEKKVVNLV